jgi:hypothetical protein
MPRSVTTNGHNQIHWPGVYEHVLERKCDRDAMFVASEYIRAPDPLSEGDVDVEAWERGLAECKAALMAERAGQTLVVQSEILPDGMPSPLFDRWPVGGSRGSFSITPDDVVTFKPRRMQWH